MSVNELKTTATLLLLKINAITGWQLHETPEIQKIFKEQFELKLTESYPLVNADEMEFAFRQNTTVKDWGKHMNLALIDEVMIPYLEQRFEVSRVEEQKSVKQLPPSEEEISDEEHLERVKNTYLKTGNWQAIDTLCYSILFRQGKIKSPEGEERQRIVNMARSHFFSERKDSGLNHGEIQRFINQDCKKIVVAEFFNEQNNQ